MPVFYKIIGRKDPLDPESGEVKYYGIQKMMATVTPETLAEYIAKRSGRSSGSVISIVNDLLTIIEEYMEQGYNVQLGALGTFQQRILNETGAATEDTFDTTLIKKITVRFRPGKLLQQKLDTVELRSFNSLKPKEGV
jgi:predicted histone-like DNA-binding protein